ncbi:helix-turn-helix domain-containing protein [Streptomyces sp. TRM72054]|uniref:PucR family transcriptional regulator n=1 Tax=Streptomyces sp. TRM72054 TaxID=2870562 RepID=UPI001C8BB692|nr:helix-turn-helix domain-containing protein [Streptomyces sp. TRM72054]MBX9392916.1 helix-turn-helix domain-containing protein [Streptomyces sp. TRM72054]
MTERLQRARPGSEALQCLVDELAEELGRSVAIDDPLVRMICTSRHFGDEDPVRVRTLLQGRADREAIRYVLAQGVAQWSKPGFVDGRDDIGLLPRYVVPLRERGHLLGLMMIVAPQQVLTEQETKAVARAARAMTAQMYAEHLAADTEESDARDLLLELLGSSSAARDAARQRALDRGLLRDTPYTVVSVIQVSRSQEPPGQIEVALRGAVEGFLQTRSVHGIMAIEQDRAILLQVRDRPPGPDELGEQSRRVIDALGTFLDASAAPVVGIGGCQAGLADAWTSYEQALVAVRAARRLPALKGVGDWEELGEFAVLLQLPEHALNESLIPKPLRTLTEANGGPRLRDTLRCFLENAGSIPKTADALQLHRTSLYYRLRQIQEITGLDLDNGADRLVLHMGLRIEELLASRTEDIGV